MSAIAKDRKVSSEKVSAFLSKVSGVAPGVRVLTDPDEAAPYASDWTKTPGWASAVVLPRDAEEVAALLALCNSLNLGVVPSGGRTGLAGGAVAKGEIVLSLERLNRILSMDATTRSLTSQAGVTTQAIHEHAAKQDLFWPIDLASKGSCHLGGNLSTNAGGLRVIRYGSARKWVTALQVATVDGQLIRINHGLEKNNTGYDLLQLILGSEGTLAIITEATLKLVALPKSKSKAVFFFGLSSLMGLEQLYEAARNAPFEIAAFEFFSAKCLASVQSVLGRKSRLAKSSAFYAILEVEGTEDRRPWLENVFASAIVEDALEAESSDERRSVWGLREGITESLQTRAPLRKYDVCVPPNATASFLSETLDEVDRKKRAFELFTFGHFGDGSPHFNLVRASVADPDAFEADCEEFEQYLFGLLKSYRGTVSAEHGVGLLKRHWLSYSRSETELRWFRAIKTAFDPKGILNPGKVLPDQG